MKRNAESCHRTHARNSSLAAVLMDLESVMDTAIARKGEKSLSYEIEMPEHAVKTA